MMFDIIRQDVLEESKWTLTKDDQVQYVEAWKYSVPDVTECIHLHRVGFLLDSENPEWLHQRGAFASLKPPNPDAFLEGSIRLLICERLLYHPLSFSMSKNSYLSVEREFGLHPATLSSLRIDSGIFSYHKTYDPDHQDVIDKISIVVKVPEKYQIANYGLSLSHHVLAGATTALLHGTGTLTNISDFKFWRKSQTEEIVTQILSCSALWSHPMLLPNILLYHHFARAERFASHDLAANVVAIQNEFGVTRSGCLRGKSGPINDVVGQGTINETKINMRELKSNMSSLISDITWFVHVSEWQCECTQFLGKVMNELPLILPRRKVGLSSEIQESIEYMASAAKMLRSYNNGLKYVMESELSVLYSVIAQIDNRLNAKMAASSSRDGTAMKTLAFITTLFLPATFVATLLSMSMFDWNTARADSSGSFTVSSQFWVYWVITIPLTGLVAAGWRFWWTLEKRNFDSDILQEIEKIERPSAPVQLPNDEPQLGRLDFKARKYALRRLQPSAIEEHV